MLEKEIERSNRMAVQAEMANVAKSVFLASMSHELRTPIATILGCVELLTDAKLTKQESSLLKMVQNRSNDLLLLLNDILDLSKIEAGKITLNVKLLNIKDTIYSAVNSLIAKASAKYIDLKVDIDSKIPESLLGDTLRVHQILLNLISNAIKFTEEGYVKVKAAEINRENLPNSIKQKKLPQDAVFIEFIVEDTGTGISQDKLEMIFEPFRQVELNTNNNPDRVGLGLAITKKLVDLMNGAVWAENKIDKGCAFHFIIQFQRGKELSFQIEEPTDSEFSKHKRKGRILLIDDDFLSRKAFKAMIEKFGYQVTTASDGEEGLEWIMNNHFDAIIVDIVITKMNGFEFTRTVRQLKLNTHSTIPIIAMTALILEDNADKCKAADMDNYVEKPIVIKDLISRLDRWIHTTESLHR